MKGSEQSDILKPIAFGLEFFPNGQVPELTVAKPFGLKVNGLPATYLRSCSITVRPERLFSPDSASGRGHETPK